MSDIPTFKNDEETLDERQARWEKEKQAIIGDLQAEREKRQALEERLGSLETDLSTPVLGNEPNIQERIERFTKDPDGYIADVASGLVEERVRSVEQRLSNREMGDQITNALEEIAEREGITLREAKKRYDASLTEIVKSRGLVNMTPYEGVLAAYDIHQTAKKEKDRNEEERTQRINGQTIDSARSYVRSGSKVWRQSDIAAIPQEKWNSPEFKQTREEIMEAQKNGLIKSG